MLNKYQCVIWFDKNRFREKSHKMTSKLDESQIWNKFKPYIRQFLVCLRVWILIWETSHFCISFSLKNLQRNIFHVSFRCTYCVHYYRATKKGTKIQKKFSLYFYFLHLYCISLAKIVTWSFPGFPYHVSEWTLFLLFNI